ncbi:hypothetical protein BC826DRAFT_1001980 [Russula brevipes]|nr:hypothetical protein BC826DRAFT_1001980 [Russula brevipes]
MSDRSDSRQPSYLTTRGGACTRPRTQRCIGNLHFRKIKKRKKSEQLPFAGRRSHAQ